MTKKATALVLALVMAFSMVPSIAFAEGIELTSRVSVNTIATESDTTVDYYVAIPTGSTIACANIEVTYDTDKLEYISGESYSALGLLNTNAGTNGLIKFGVMGFAALPAGDLFRLSFKANDSLPADCDASITAIVPNASDASAVAITATIPTQTVAITVTNPAKLTVTGKKILVGGDHNEGTISFETVKLSGLTASDISAAADPDVLDFGTPSIESGSGSIPFTVKDGAEAGKVTVTVKAGDFSDECEVFVDKPAVAGDLNVGGTVTATSLLEGASFNWTVMTGAGADTKIFDRGSGQSYTLVEEDKGGMVRLDVTAEGYEGMDYIHVGTVLGAKPAKPLLECASQTATSVTLKAVEGAEYRLGDGAWQDSPVFTGLEPNTTYTFAARVKAVAGVKPAGDIAQASFTTADYPEVKVYVNTNGHCKVELPEGCTWTSETGTDSNGNAYDGYLTVKGNGEFSFKVVPKEGHYLEPALPTPTGISVTDTAGDYKEGYWVFTCKLDDPTDSSTVCRIYVPANPMRTSDVIVYDNGKNEISEDQTLVYTGSPVKVKTYEPDDTNIDADAGYTYHVMFKYNPDLPASIYYWADENGTKLEGDPVNAGTYTLYAGHEGNYRYFESVKEKFTLTITKAEQAAPQAPTLVSRTEDSITVKLENAAEGAKLRFGIADGEGSITWYDADSDSYTFTGLEPYTEYTFYVRKAGSDNHFASEPSEELKARTMPAAQNVTVIVKDTDGNTVPSGHYTVHEVLLGGEKIPFGGKLIYDEPVDIIIELTEEGKKLYKAASSSAYDWTFDGLDATIYAQDEHIYRAEIRLTDPTKGGSTTLTLTPKDVFEVRVKQGGQGGSYTFDSMEKKVTASMPYTGSGVCYTKSGELGSSFGSYTEKSNYFLICSNSTEDSADIYWVDAEGNKITGYPKNVGTYKLMAFFDGNADTDFKPLAPTAIVELTVEKGEQAAPATPTLVSKTANSLTVRNDESGVEWMLYSSKNGNMRDPITGWVQGENGQVTFDGLTDGTRYFIYARYAENDNQNASEPCETPLQADTVYVPKKIKVFGYTGDLNVSGFIPDLFEIYLADADGNPTDEKITTITAGESNEKKAVIMLTESAREQYYLEGYPGAAPSGGGFGVNRKNSKSLNAYSIATTIYSDLDKTGDYLEENDTAPYLAIKVIEKQENTFLVSKNGAAAVAAPVVESIPYNGSAFTAQGALQASEDAVFTVIPAITDTGMQVPAVCWKDANGEAVANPVNVGTYYLYASLEAGTMWKATPETLVLTLTVEKGEQAAPARAPEKVSATTDSVTVKLADAKKVQFAIDDGTGSLTWYDAASDGTYTFTGLEDYTKYTVVARYAANDNQLASPAGTALEVQTEPAPQNIGVKVKCGDKELNVADFKVYEGSSFFDWKITGAEEATITVKLSDDAKATYKPNACSVVADGIAAVKGTCENGEYSATVSLTDYTKGGIVTFNLTEKETISVRVSKEQVHFEKMQTSLTDTKTYDGKAVKWLDITYKPYTGSEEFAYFIKNDKNIFGMTATGWYDAQGNRLTGSIRNPVNVGTYKLIAKYSGNDDCKPLAETLLVTLTINPAVMGTPVAPTLGEVTANSISYTGVAGQKYAVTTSATAPDADAALWKECTAAGTVTETGLEPNTQYYIHTFVPAASTNHADSEVAAVSVATKHSYGVEVAEETTLTWNVRIGTAPNALASVMGQTMPVKSTGTGDIFVRCTNSDGSPFGTSVTELLIKQSDPEKVLPFTLKNNMISTDELGSVSYTYTYTVREDDATGEVIKNFKVTCVVNVIDKEIVTFTNFEDVSVTYGDSYDMETAVPGVADGVAPYTGALVYTYTDANGNALPAAPTAAGTYTVKAAVPDTDPNYAGSASAKLVIAKKALALTGLTAADKVYDGTKEAEVDTSAAKLEGVVSGDSVGFTVTAAFNSKNALEANVVEVTAALTGEAAVLANYTLDDIEPLSAEITPKEIGIVVTAEDKVYDGTADAVVSAAYAENSGLLEADVAFVTLTAAGGTFTDALVGTDKPVSGYTVTLEDNSGNDVASNYTVSFADAVTADITAAEVTVTFEGSMSAVYDGSAKPVTARVNGLLEGDTASVTVLYGGSSAAPTLAGEYLLTAEGLTNANYKLSAAPYTQAENERTLKIDLAEYVPETDSVQRQIGYLDTAAKEYALDEIFGVGIGAAISNVALTDASHIIAGSPAQDGMKLTFAISEGSGIGESASFRITFTPAAENTYKPFEVTLDVVVAQESIESMEVKGMQEEIAIGDDIDLSGVTLVVTFESGAVRTYTNEQYTALTDYEAPYDSADLGTKQLTLTASENGAEYTASVNFTVKDWAKEIAMGSMPAKTEYELGATAIDVSGGSVKVTYGSGAEKSVSLSDPSVTLSEVTEEMLRTVGAHTVKVTYTENGEEFETEFTVNVVVTSVENPGEGETGGTVDETDEFLTDPENSDSTLGGDVTVTLVIGAPRDGAAAAGAVETKYPVVKDRNIALNAELVASDGSKVYAKQPVSAQVAYPAGTDSKDSFMIYLVDEAGNITSITPAKEDRHIAFELPAGFSESDFVLAWQKYESGVGGGDDDGESTFRERQRKFWKSVRSSIEKAKPGKVLVIGAGDYDQMPTYIMDAVKEHNVGLRILWNGGKEIVLVPENALDPEANRLYYPLAYLAKNLRKVELGAGGIIILTPQTGDDRPVTDHSMGFFAMPGAAAENAQNVLSAKPEIALVAANGSMSGAGILMLAGSLAALAAGWFVTNRRKEEK